LPYIKAKVEVDSEALAYAAMNLAVGKISKFVDIGGKVVRWSGGRPYKSIWTALRSESGIINLRATGRVVRQASSGLLDYGVGRSVNEIYGVE